jgi:DHA1 family bicyclomycin/chloramphenicol resistance-like MFS transporter
MFSMSLAYMGGTFLCRRAAARAWACAARWRPAAVLTLPAGTLHGRAGAGGLAVAPTVVAIMLPYYLFMVAHGIHQPCSQSGAVGPFPAGGRRGLGTQWHGDDAGRLPDGLAGWAGTWTAACCR